MGEQRAISRRDVDESARAELVDVVFRRHYAALLRLAVVMVGDRGAAEDAVQDAFVSLHRNWRSCGTRGPPRPTSGRRCSTAVVRGYGARSPSEPRDRCCCVQDGPPKSPEETTVARDEVGSLVAAMRTLARRQREVLACRYVLELSVAETAELLDISEGSVKIHTHRGLQTLQQRIEVTR